MNTKPVLCTSPDTWLIRRAICCRALANGISLLALAVAAGSAATLPAQAQAVWAGGVSEDWFDGRNWSGGAPGSSQDVTVNGLVRPPVIAGSGQAETGSLVVGGMAPGMLTIKDGALNAYHVAIGMDGGEGAIIVTGPNAALTSNTAISLGLTGSGMLEIRNGATVTSHQGIIGAEANSFGTVILDGSDWITTGGGMIIGSQGEGHFTVSGGGFVNNEAAYLGYSSGSSGSLTVTGPGSTWLEGGDMYVGYFGGSGNLVVNDGGFVRVSNSLYVSYGSEGTASVSGDGTRLEVWGALSVGGEADGALTISDGATVTSQWGVIGSAAGSQGTVTVTGSGSSWTTSEFGGGLTIGQEGSGAMTVTDGARVEADELYIAHRSGANGTLVISDGGQVSATYVMMSIEDGANGALRLESGGVLEAAQVERYDGAGTVVFDGGTLRLTDTQSALFSGFATGDVTLESAGGTIDTGTYNVQTDLGFVGAGGLTKVGTGTLQFWGANTYSGTTFVDQGTLRARETNVLSAASTHEISSGATLRIDNNRNQTIGGLAGSGSVLLGNSTLTIGANGASTTYGGVISGSGSLVKTGAGTLTLSGTNTYSGGTTINGGILQLGNAGNTGTIAGAVTVGFDGRFDVVKADTSGITSISSNNVVNFYNDTSGGTANITNNHMLSFFDGSTAGSATITTNVAQFFRDSSTAGSAGITIGNGHLSFMDSSKAGSARITNNADLYFFHGSTAGSATIANNDKLYFKNNSAAGDAGIANNSDLYFSETSTAGRATITNSGAVYFDDTSKAGNANIINGGGLYFHGGSTAADATITNSSAVYFYDTSTAGSASIINNHDLFFDQNSTAGNAAIFNSAAGTADFSNSRGLNGDHKLSAGSIAGAGEYILGANELTVGSNDRSTEVSGVISGAGGALVKTGTGTLTLSGANNYDGGTTISAGTLQIGNGGATGSIIGNVINNGVLALNRTGTLTLSGDISGSGALHQTGSGMTILTGANSYSGGTTISGGTLQIGNGGSIVGDVQNDGALVFNRTGTLTLSGDISGNGTVRQTGSGTTILTGSNSYTGDTTVYGGRLQFGDGSVGGSNTLGGNINVNLGTLAIQTPATLNVARDVNFTDNTTLSIVAGANGPALSADSMTIGNDVAFNISGIDDASQHDKVLIDTHSGISGDFATVTVGGFSGTVNYLTVSTRKSADSLQYLASYGLSWNASNDLAHGTFTLTDAADTFTVGTSLADQAANAATGWDGTSLTKAGAGTLILTADNTYSGDTTISGGTLQLGNGGATGSILGDVVNNGLLTFNRSDDITFSGAISGGGAVGQTGTGTTTLTGDNTYNGGTTILGGMLQIGNGGASGSIVGNVVNNGALAFSRSDDIIFSGDIFGSGAVRQTGTGTTTLTGTNSHTGGTTIATGTLQIGNGGASGSIVGNVVNDGVLDFNRGDDVAFSGAISGSGAVRQTGTGTTTLIGTNSYSGGTTIAAGTLQIGDGGASGSISGNVVNNGALAFNRTGTLTLAGDISGSGSVRQTGSGTMILTGTNSYTGDTTVSGGRLQFGDGGSGGSNTLGGNVNVTGGTLAIETPATLNVAQAVTFANNTALSIVAGNSPALSADSMTIGNGVAFNISGIDDASQHDKVLIDTTSGISGDFATVSVGGFSGAVDFLTVSIRKSDDSLQYLASYGLSWASGNNLANGTFTLTGAADTFTVGTTLADQAANAVTGWNGTSLTKAGAGTLILTGDNSYSGGTTILGGVLSVSRDANLGAASGGLTFTDGMLSTTASFDTARAVWLTQAGGRFDVAAGSELGLTGVVSGSGDLIKQGDGTLRLDNAANAYGDTLVAGGTLVGNTGSISGNIGNAGTVVFDQAGNASFAGDISALDGTRGAVVKRGAGALTLAGSSSLDWTIEAGGLVAAAERFGGNAAIASGASFTFDQSANAAYAGVLSGHGGFSKTGAGLLNLTGDSSAFAGATTVGNGVLAVNGKLGGVIDVLTTGRLQGTGTIGNTTVAGTIAPGNSIGTLNVAGNITFNAGSIYEVEVNMAGQSDKIVATGTATIDGGSVKVLAGAGNYAPATTYTILTAAGGRSGTFTEGVTSNFAFLDPSLSYDANNVYLTMTRNNIAFQAIGVTPNQIATGGGVESLGLGNPVYNAVLNLSVPQAQYAYDQLSGEIHASEKTALIEDSRFIRNAVNDRIRAAFDAVGTSSGTVVTYEDGKPIPFAATTDRFAVWGQGFGSWGHTDGDGNAARLNRSTGGFFFGADAPAFDSWRFGAVAGYSRTSFDVKDRHSSGSSDNYHVGLYGGTQRGDLAFRMGAAYAWHDIATNRNVMFPGFGVSLKGDYNAATAQVFGELGYGINTSAARFEPFASLAYVNLHTDGFTERGGAAALTGAAANTNATFTTLGLRASTTFDLGGASLTTKGTLGWRHAFDDVTPRSTVRFAGGGDAFSIGGVPIARDAAVIEAGVDYAITPAATLGISYGGQFGSGLSDQSARASFNVKF